MSITTETTEWEKLKNYNLAGIKFNLIDRFFLFSEIARYCVVEKFFFWNPGYRFIQKIIINFEEEKNECIPTEYYVNDTNALEEILKIFQQVNYTAILVIEGFGQISNQSSFQLRNFYFDSCLLIANDVKHQIFIVDEKIEIPLSMYSLVPVLEYKSPNLKQIKRFLAKNLGVLEEGRLSQACIGLSKGEIEILIKISVNDRTDLFEKIINYKTRKLAGRGFKIASKPDVTEVGGLDELERDLSKIKKLFTLEAFERGLQPPKGCLLWGLPGTGKSLVAKLMSKKLGATLISCDWNELLESSLSSSLANLQYVLDTVDNIGNCVLFFDEFEKAFSGWNSGANGGILAKLAGKLLTWMQDHESPSIMLATINHLDMLPPELIRRFAYIWFFDSEMHHGAMWSVFKIHLSKHFNNLHEKITDSQWKQLFLVYRGCSPDEIAKAIQRTHHEIFFMDKHLDLEQNILFQELLAERKRFKPAITNKTTSNQLAKILREADFARSVRGEDTSKFSVVSRELFEDDSSKIGFDEYEELFYKLVQSEPNGRYSYI